MEHEEWLLVSFKDYRIDVPKKWKDSTRRCKVMEFLQQDPGRDIVSDFYSDLKSQNGSRFPDAFESAVKVLSQRIHAYWHKKISERIKPESYRAFDSEVVRCLEKEHGFKEVIEIIAACLFWVLHDQST